MYPYIVWLLFPGVPLAITVMGVLAVDVGTDLVPAMGLGIEPPEQGIMERAPRRRDGKLLSIGFILQNYFIQGTLVTLSCYATYLYFGWIMGYWQVGAGLRDMPATPAGLKLNDASFIYLQSLTAYFFPAVTTQLANVHCQRSWKSSLFSRDFLNAEHRRAALTSIANWRPPQYTTRVRIDYQVREITKFSVFRTFSWLKSLERIEGPVIVPFTTWLAHFLERHYIIFNFISNPLIDLGIIFELVLCYAFFYTPLAQIYYFAPVPWHVYLFAFHGTVLLFAFEETKKYYRRKGHRLECLG
jgi:magnesium-transporting ATPase (P-type)